MSTARTWLIAALGAAALIVAAGVVVSFLPTRSGTSVAGQLLGSTDARTPASSGQAGAETAAPSPGASRGPGSSATLKPTTQDDSLLGGQESPPTATPTPYRLPTPTQPPAQLAAEDLAVAPDSKVTSKSVSKDGTTTQVTIDATTSSKPADTVSYYQGVLTSLGMTGTPVPAVDGSTAIAFSRGGSTVTLTVSAHDKGSRYTLFGVLRPAA